MSGVPERSIECEAINDDLIEFALGTLTGRDRSRVLDHLETCGHCNAEVESLADVADKLLWLAPEAEPTLGFESRVIERFRGSEVHRRVARRRVVSVLAAAALLLAVLGVSVDALVNDGGASGQPSATIRPTTGRLMSDGQVLGDVTISTGNPSWMIMDVDAGKLSGEVWCQVTLTNGRRETVGRFTITDGYGSWVAPLNTVARNVRSARIVNKNDTVLAAATFRA